MNGDHNVGRGRTCVFCVALPTDQQDMERNRPLPERQLVTEFNLQHTHFAFACTQMKHIYAEASFYHTFCGDYERHSRLSQVDIDRARDTQDLWKRSEISNLHVITDMKRLDLPRVEVRADLVHIWVVRDERVLRDAVRGRDGSTSVPRLDHVGSHTVLAGETQADNLCHGHCMSDSNFVRIASWRHGSPRRPEGCRSSHQ